MKAMVMRDWGEASFPATRPDPEPGLGEAVMRVRAAGVGLTLLNMRAGRLGGSTPRVMGHELGGDIVAIGAGVKGLSIGDRCTGYFYLKCNRCRWCRAVEKLCAKILVVTWARIVMVVLRITFASQQKIFCLFLKA